MADFAAEASPTGQTSTGLAIGVDVGGSKLAAGLVAADGRVVSRAREDTPATDPEAIDGVIAAVARRLADDEGVWPAPVGVGAAGLVDLDGLVRYAPNVAWANYPLQARLRERLGPDVTVENDANAAAWGEYRVGSAAAARASMLMLTVGTGVGGGRVAGDSLAKGATGLGAEFGHIIVSDGGPGCGCGNAGCLEAVASGNAIGRAAAEALAADEPPADSAVRGLGELTGKSVTTAAHGGDPFAHELVAGRGRWLGVGIASLVNALDPELVVVGGGAIEAGELLLDPARQAYHARLIARGHREPPGLVRASLGDDAGVVGAALAALEASGCPG